MYNTTKNFEKAILGDNRTLRAKIKTGKYETEDGFISIKHYMKSVENSITVGGAVSSYVEVEMWKPDFFIENSELQIFIGIDVEDEKNVLLDTLGGKILDANSNNILTVSSQEKTEWIPLGLFTAQKPKNDNEIVTFTAYDRIESKLSGAFFSDLKYPIDAKKILEEISQKTGVPINISDLPNGVEIAQREVISESDVDEEGNETTTTTYENPFNGYTYREALGYIAMLYCRFAIVDRTGTIKLVWYTDANYEVNTDRYYDDLVTQDEIFMVSKISCAVGEKTIYAGDGTTSILLENPVMTQERLDYIYNTIKELNFLPASTSFYGDIRLDIGDIVTLNDKYGNVIKIPLMSVTQEFDGGLLTVIQSYGSGEESTQSGGQITKMVNRTYTELFLVKEIVGTKASFDYVRAKIGEFEELSSNFLKVNDADIKYAKIDLANVNNAWIENGQIKKASITNAEIADATIESAKIKSINADTINTGTLKTKHLIIVSDDGKESIVGVINASNGVPEGEVNSKKIQAASIDVVDLSAFQAKIAGFNLKEYAIYADKQSATGKDGEIYLSTDRLFMGVGAINMDLDTPFQVYANGSFRLVGRNSKFDFNSTTGDMDIEVSKLKIASKSVATSDDIANLMNERTTVLKIESSNGAPLDENSTSTVLRVIIYRGRTRITNALDLKKEMGEVSLLWLSRKEGEEYKSISANDNRISDSGFTFTPNEDDIKNRCSFRCRLISDGSGYINPDQATAVDRIEARLKDYVDNTLIPTVKSEIISEISKDTYIAKIEKNEKDISELKRVTGGSKPIEQDFHLAWLGWSNNIERGNGIENDAIMFSKHDIVGTQRLDLYSLASSKPTFTVNTLKILKRAKELNPKLRTFEYIQSESGRTDFTYNGDHAHLNSDGSWEGSTADLSGCTRIYTYQQICDWLDYFKDTGTDGIFFDDWGYDFAKEDICYQFQWDPDEFESKNDALNKKWIMLIEACHTRGLFLITNGGMPFSVGDWYTYLDENDIICLESCLISSAGDTWQMGQKSIYNYYANWYSTGKCKAKIWSQNYFPSDAELYKEEVLTYLCAMTYACGGNYVSMGTFKCIEMPEFMNLFSDGDTKTIKKIDDNTYQLKINNHVLEVHQWKNLSGRVSEKTVNKNYYILDGKRFNNGFLRASIVDYELTESINQVSEKLNSIGEDSKKNAISYWRMAIDDWDATLSYLDYTNLILIDPEPNGIANGTIQTVKKSDGTVDIVCKYNKLEQGGIHLKIIRPSNYEGFNQTGSGLEFGFSDVIFDMSEDSWTLPNGTVYEAAYLWAIPSFYIYTGSTPLNEESVANYKIDGVGSELGSATGHYIRSQKKIYSSYDIKVWFHAPAGKYFNGTITIKNAYLIDLGEHGDEVSKKWYTNIFPSTFNNTSAMAAQRTLAEKKGQKVYDFTVSHTDAWGWTKYKYTGDELLALRGHTIEFGCSSLSFSNGSTGVGNASNGWVNYAFGIGVNNDNPTTMRLYSDTANKSEVWNEKICCFKYTIPDDATSLTIGFQSFGFPKDVTLTIKDAYMYDLGEEVSIRGETPTNASLRLCRVTEKQENLTPSNMRNTLYMTEKGRMYCYDLGGKKIDIAGSIYIGATEAGYTGTPEEFGNALYQLIQSNISP